MNIQKNIQLKDYTTFKIGGPADYFAEVKNIEEAKEIFEWAKKNKQKVLIIGAGSNIVISDSGFRGLVVKLNLKKLEFDSNKVTAGAGVMLTYLLNQCLEHNLTGLEFVAGIPGTVGGAVRGNAGTYGLSISSVVKKIKYLDEHYRIKEMLANQAKFAYRHSIFKEKKLIILEVELELSKGNVEEARKLVEERLQYRQDTQPNEPSAGCIFKNIPFSEVDIDELEKKGVEVDKFFKYKKIPAAYLIEKLGLKGQTMGGAQISEKHANYIINKGNATAEQVVMLISFIKQQVRDKYGIQLHEEVQLVI